MEESEKRRQRLREMQREAKQHDDAKATSPPTALLLEPPKLDESTPAEETVVPFGFYTDPLAAFSGVRRKFYASPSSFRPNYSHSPLEVAEARPLSSEFHPGQHYSHRQIPPSPLINPGFQQHQQPTVPESSNCWGATATGTPWPGYPTHSSGSSVAHAVRPIWQPKFYSPPPPSGASRQSPASVVLNTPPFQSPTSLSPKPSYHPPSGSPSNNHRGLGFPEKNSTGSSGGRGIPFFGYSRSPCGRGESWLDSGGSSQQTFPRSGSGRGRGRARSSRFSGSRSVSAKEHPQLFYNKSMLEDPWKILSPKPYPIHQNQSWFPKSMDSKKSKASEFKARASGLSLAESLESAFAAAVDDSDENVVPSAMTAD